MRLTKKYMVVLIGCLVSLFATAQEIRPRYVSPMGLFIDTGNDRDTDDGLGVRFAFGAPLSDALNLELGGYGATVETSREATDLYTYGIGADLMLPLSHEQRLTPFLLAGGGMSYNDTARRDGDDTSGYVNAGAGLLSGPLFDTPARARLEVRYVRDFFSHDLEDMHIGLGIQVPLGRIPERVVKERVVINETVEVAVNAPDSDGDTVPDGRDRCPNTLKGARVDARGCIIESQILTVRSINFVTGSDELLPESERVLDTTALALKAQQNLALTINGHTDDRGAQAYNQDLSQRRAESVRRYLVNAGVAPERLTARGYGEERPIASNDSVEGRAMNRRVEFELQVDDQGGAS